MSRRVLIADMQPSQFVQGVFAIHNCQLGQTRSGKPYLKCLISDRSKRVPGRMWNVSEEILAQLPTDGFVYLEGQTQPYQGELQIIIQQIRPYSPTPEELQDLLPRAARDPEQMFQELVGILSAELRDPALRALFQAFLDDRALMDRFRQAPAAQTLHHAYLGGLLEHTLTLVHLARAVHPFYSQVNLELVLLGLFIHDMGKCLELNWEAGFTYTDAGHLVGHVAQGLLLLQQKADLCASRGQPVPSAVLMVLQHILISHHGKAEFGALKPPATPEALLISLLDNLDAKMQMILSAAARSSADTFAQASDLGGNFTEKVWALETRVFRPDPTTLENK